MLALFRSISKTALLVLCAGLLPLSAQTPKDQGNTEMPAQSASAALQDIVTAFWVGDPVTGHLQNDALERSDKYIGGWEQCQAMMAFYWSWKYLGDEVSGQRVAAQWNWLKKNIKTPDDLVICGKGAKYNFASDDTGWNVGFYLAAYDVTHDLAALIAAMQSLDIAWNTWWSTDLGGGYWYNLDHTDKAMYQAVLTMENAWAYRLTKIDTFRERALASEKWTVEKLRREDGLYWKGMHLDGKTPPEGNRYLINPTQSVTMIVGNMAQAIAEVWLYEDTKDAAFLKRAIETAAGIRKYEVDRNGVLINDQDGFTDGWAMAPFAYEVLHKIPSAEQAAWTKVLRQSALAIRQNDRNPNGTYGADWGGPLTGGPWEQQGKALAQKISVTGGAVNVIVAAAVAEKRLLMHEIPNVTVKEDNWGDASVPNIQALLANVMKNFFASFPEPPTGEVEVSRSNASPIILNRKSPQDVYQVRLNVSGRYWAQFSYQFAHEMCHLACNYQRFPETNGKPHPFMWFQESLCETASLFTLRRMAEDWKTDPPYGRWKDYAPRLQEYAQKDLDEPERQLPPGMHLGDWYAANRDLLKANAGLRQLNNIVAVRLLPVFEAHPEGWQTLRWLPISTGTLPEYFKDWLAAVPPKYAPFIKNLAAEFQISL